MDLNLQNKVILVTGGAKGIGEGIVNVLAAEGAIPVIIGRNQADNQKVVAQIEAAGQQAFQIVAELNQPGDSEQAVKTALAQFGRIDGIVNNAGMHDHVSLETGNYEAFMASLHKNLVHYYLIVHHALPALKESKGPIVNISSKLAETGQGSSSSYAAANGGRNALTREWAVELIKYGIRVNSIIVAECWTSLYEKWINGLPNPQETLARIVARIPFENRMSTPEEIGNTAAFLLSSRSSHTTGQLIHIDGGYVHLDRALVNAPIQEVSIPG